MPATCINADLLDSLWQQADYDEGGDLNGQKRLQFAVRFGLPETFWWGVDTETMCRADFENMLDQLPSHQLDPLVQLLRDLHQTEPASACAEYSLAVWKALFNFFDPDDTGYVRTDELARFGRKLQLSLQWGAKIPKDSTHDIDFDRFCVLFSRVPTSTNPSWNSIQAGYSFFWEYLFGDSQKGVETEDAMRFGKRFRIADGVFPHEIGPMLSPEVPSWVRKPPPPRTFLGMQARTLNAFLDDIKTLRNYLPLYVFAAAATIGEEALKTGLVKPYTIDLQATLWLLFNLFDRGTRRNSSVYTEEVKLFFKSAGVELPKLVALEEEGIAPSTMGWNMFCDMLELPDLSKIDHHSAKFGIRSLWEWADTDGSGNLNLPERQRFMLRLGLTKVRWADVDGDSQMSFDEFYQMVLGLPSDKRKVLFTTGAVLAQMRTNQRKLIKQKKGTEKYTSLRDGKPENIKSVLLGRLTKRGVGSASRGSTVSQSTLSQSGEANEHERESWLSGSHSSQLDDGNSFTKMGPTVVLPCHYFPQAPYYSNDISKALQPHPPPLQNSLKVLFDLLRKERRAKSHKKPKQKKFKLPKKPKAIDHDSDVEDSDPDSDSDCMSTSSSSSSSSSSSTSSDSDTGDDHSIDWFDTDSIPDGTIDCLVLREFVRDLGMQVNQPGLHTLVVNDIHGKPIDWQNFQTFFSYYTLPRWSVHEVMGGLRALWNWACRASTSDTERWHARRRLMARLGVGIVGTPPPSSVKRITVKPNVLSRTVGGGAAAAVAAAGAAAITSIADLYSQIAKLDCIKQQQSVFGAAALLAKYGRVAQQHCVTCPTDRPPRAVFWADIHNPDQQHITGLKVLFTVLDINGTSTQLNTHINGEIVVDFIYQLGLSPIFDSALLPSKLEKLNFTSFNTLLSKWTISEWTVEESFAGLKVLWHWVLSKFTVNEQWGVLERIGASGCQQDMDAIPTSPTSSSSSSNGNDKHKESNKSISFTDLWYRVYHLDVDLCKNIFIAGALLNKQIQYCEGLPPESTEPELSESDKCLMGSGGTIEDLRDSIRCLFNLLDHKGHGRVDESTLKSFFRSQSTLQYAPVVRRTAERYASMATIHGTKHHKKGRTCIGLGEFCSIFNDIQLEEYGMEEVERGIRTIWNWANDQWCDRLYGDDKVLVQKQILCRLGLLTFAQLPKEHQDQAVETQQQANRVSSKSSTTILLQQYLNTPTPPPPIMDADSVVIFSDVIALMRNESVKESNRRRIAAAAAIANKYLRGDPHDVPTLAVGQRDMEAGSSCSGYSFELPARE